MTDPAPALRTVTVLGVDRMMLAVFAVDWLLSEKINNASEITLPLASRAVAVSVAELPAVRMTASGVNWAVATIALIVSVADDC